MAKGYINELSSIPAEFTLLQNYPNPFNPETTIQFGLPHESKVVLKIYNLIGQEIKTLVNENRKAGFHKITWQGDNNFGQRVSSGVYLYKLYSGNFVEIKKMVVIQ